MSHKVTPHAVVAAAERQHRVISARQLAALGVSRDRVARWVRAGWLRGVHRGVYAVGDARLTVRGRWMAAVLAAGPGAALSHRSAAALRGIRRSTAIEVTVSGRCRRPGIRVHKSRLRPDEIETVDGITCTTVARTLLDLAAVLPKHALDAAVNEAEYLRLADHVSLDDLVARYPRRRGTPVLKRLLADRLHGRARSELELAFMAFLDAHRLPRPRRNLQVLGLECDCVWPEHRLIVELDGEAAHRTTSRFHSDRARDRRLTLAGWRVLRVTQFDADLAADLRRATTSPWRPSG